MEIKYIWVQEHRALKNFGFNFSHTGEHTFEFVDDQLLLKKNQEYPIDFGEKISSITAIAGKNGSGKSSFCEIVLGSVATLVNGSFGYNYTFDGIVCFGDHFFIHKDIALANELKLKESGYQVVWFEESPFEEMRPEWRNTFIKNGFIYYSNYLDRRSTQNETNLLNTSTQNNLIKDRYYSTHFPYRLRSGEPNEDWGYDKFDQYQSYVIQEDYKHLRLITSFPELTSFIGSYTFVSLISTYSGNNRFINSAKSNKSIEYLEEIERSIFDTIHTDVRDQSNKVITYNSEQMSELIKRMYKVNIATIFVSNDSYYVDAEELRRFVYEGYIPTKWSNLKLAELISVHGLLVADGELIGEFNPATYQWQYRKTKDWRFYVMENVYISLNDSTRKNFRKLMDLEDKILNEGEHSLKRISNYSIQPYFSSGEYSFLSIFSRIYDAILRHQKGIDDRNHLILFLDEAEVGFHPEWSRTFVKILLDFLNRDFHDFKFQIILTTHSPYILSDLPHQNVRLLYRDNETPLIVREPKSETFGANIYDLFADSFFLSNGFIGEFAKQKIEALFEELYSLQSLPEPISAEQYSVYYRRVSMIGERIIRIRLMDVLESVPHEKSNLEKEIEATQEKLNELRNKMKGNEEN